MRGGHSAVERREEQRSRHRREDDDRDDGEHDGRAHVGRAQPEDRPEEDAHAGRPVRAAPVCREDGEEEHAQSERPREERSDDDVVGSRPVAEGAHDDAAEDGGEEEPRPQVDAERCGRERSRERDVAQCVACEHLRAQHDEPADEPAGDSDDAPGDERVAHELLREHQRRTTRASTYTANDSDVM